jgi:hypothetical protein
MNPVIGQPIRRVERAAKDSRSPHDSARIAFGDAADSRGI